jgi:CRP-like cAMP-binding protein
MKVKEENSNSGYSYDKKQTLFERLNAGLGPEELAFLATIVKEEFVPKDKILVDLNVAVKEVFFIEKGIVRLFYLNEKGEEMNTHFAWDGMLITSYYSLLKQQPSDECLKTLTDCHLFRAPYSAFVESFDRFPRIERMTRVAAEQSFLCTAERSRYLQTLVARDRYEKFLKSTPLHIFQQMPLLHIASYLGIAPGSLSRIRNEFLHIC